MDRASPCRGGISRKGLEKVKQTEVHEQSNSQPEAGRKRRVSRLAVFLIVVILIAAGFGAGIILEMQTWRQEKAGLNSKIAAQVAELSALKSRELLWQLNTGMSAVYIDLTETNFGLAHDEMDALGGILAKASADLDAATKSQLASLPPLMDEIAQKITALSPDAKSKARETMGLLRKLIGANGT